MSVLPLFLKPPCKENAAPLDNPVRVTIGKNLFGPGVTSIKIRCLVNKTREVLKYPKKSLSYSD